MDVWSVLNVHVCFDISYGNSESVILGVVLVLVSASNQKSMGVFIDVFT
jgi:hypothetical protein